MCAGDVGNKYLEAYTTTGKVAFIAGPEFRDNAGHLMLIAKALYGLKSSGFQFHDLLAEATEVRFELVMPSLIKPEGHHSLYAGHSLFTTRDRRQLLKLLP